MERWNVVIPTFTRESAENIGREISDTLGWMVQIENLETGEKVML